MNKKKNVFTMAIATALLTSSAFSRLPYPIYAQDNLNEFQEEENLQNQELEMTQISQEEAKEDGSVPPTTNINDEKIDQDFEVIESNLNGEEKVNENPDVTNSDSTTLNTVYVSDQGYDENEGSETSPVLTLNKAVELVSDGGTIYLLSDLTMTESVRINDKSVTINGNGHRVHRSEDFVKVQDNARSTYNPAMFEINNWRQDSGDHVLTFEDIVLDDNGLAAGTVFTQQSTDQNGGNEDKVQDAIIASYTSNDIVLKQGTILQNYGGMSAVRITSNAKLIMEEGSIIQDTQKIERGNCVDEKNDKTGQAGAIWIQGGQLDMQAGSSIKNMIGRAIYLDGGTANVGGTISNIAGRTTMWQGASGIAIHVRNEGSAVFSGHITNISADVDGGEHVEAIRNNSSNFESTAQSKIDYIDNMPVLFGYYSKDNIGGTVENCSFDYLFRATYNNMTFTDTALIQNNICRKGVAKAVVYSTNGANYIFNGQMKNNDAKYAFYIINHGGKGSALTMNEGAKLIGNGSDTGVYVNASGCQFEMNGGEITNFSTGVNVRGKNNSSASFIMNGGHIYDNKSQGINFNGVSDSRSIVQLNKGIIENNGNNEVYMSGGNSTDTNEHISIALEIIKGNHKVKLPYGTVTLDQNYPSIQFGRVKDDAVNKIKEFVNKQQPNWKVIGSNALWFKPSTASLHFKLDRPYSVDTNGLFLAYVPLNEKGEVNDNAEICFHEVDNEEIIDIQLDNLSQNTSYALMLVNNDTYHVAPKTTIIYPGKSNDPNSGGLPDEVDLIEPRTINSIEVDEYKETYQNNRVEQEEAEEDLQELFEYSYETEDGQPLEDNTVPGSYVSTIEFKHEPDEFKINDNDVKLEEGQLIIRHVSDLEKALNGELETKINNTEPTEPVQKALAVVDDKSQFYINGDSERETTQDQIYLFDDELYGNVDKDLIQKGDAYLQNTTKEIANAYDFHYLDFIDRQNGNAYVTIKKNWSGKDTLIYLPYPKDKDKTTEFKVLYFSDFNREYLMNDEPSVEDVAEATQVSELPCEKTDEGIKFVLPEGQSGVFALVWQVDRSSLPNNGDHSNSSNSSSPSTPKQDLDSVYRAYNPNNGEHFYTLDQKEFKYITSIGWNDEGIAFMAEGKTSGQGLCQPLYRVYNPNSGLHHYTIDENEKNVLVSLGWHDEKIAWYASTKPMHYPVYRLYNPNDGHHLYTMDQHEKEVLDSIGWDYEGIAFRTAPIEKE